MAILKELGYAHYFDVCKIGKVFFYTSKQKLDFANFADFSFGGAVKIDQIAVCIDNSLLGVS